MTAPSRVHQIAQHADDLERATAFYRDVLGLRHLATFDPPGLVFFDLGNARLLLERGASAATLYLEVDDIDARHAELAAAGVASLMVPFPHAVDDHQTFNAKFLADQGAALLMPQSELTADRLAGLLRELTREQLLEIAARALARPDAARRVADVCEEAARSS